MATYTPRINGRSIVSMAFEALRADEAKAARASKKKEKPEVAAAKKIAKSAPAKARPVAHFDDGSAAKAFGRATLQAIVDSPKTARLLGVAKESVVRSEPYRRLVAAMPCANCSRQGHSQAAHLPPSGKGIKTDDRECFPLCADGPRAGQQGCHPLFDQFKLVPGGKPGAVKQGKRWAVLTRAAIEADGSWPKKLPKFTTRGKT